MTDANGKLYEHLEYFPFGETWVQEHSNTLRTPYLFTGKEFDQETGLYYFGARYYDPRTSVWQSADPIDRFTPKSPTIGLNLYQYVLQNPLRLTDPIGMAEQSAWERLSSSASDYWHGTGSFAPTTPDHNSASSAFKDTGRAAWNVTLGTLEASMNLCSGALPGFPDYVPALHPYMAEYDTPSFGVTLEVLTGVGILKAAGAGGGVGATANDTTRVGRWMAPKEFDSMKQSGRVQESISGTTHVANPADASAFINQAKPGSLYAEFGVPSSSLKATNEGWAKIIGPNSLEGRLAARNGLPIP